MSQCKVCGSTAKFACSGCRSVYYCGVKCAQQHWDAFQHWKHCGIRISNNELRHRLAVTAANPDVKPLLQIVGPNRLIALKNFKQKRTFILFGETHHSLDETNKDILALHRVSNENTDVTFTGKSPSHITATRLLYAIVQAAERQGRDGPLIDIFLEAPVIKRGTHIFSQEDEPLVKMINVFRDCLQVTTGKPGCELQNTHLHAIDYRKAALYYTDLNSETLGTAVWLYLDAFAKEFLSVHKRHPLAIVKEAQRLWKSVFKSLIQDDGWVIWWREQLVNNYDRRTLWEHFQERFPCELVLGAVKKLFEHEEFLEMYFPNASRAFRNFISIITKGPFHREFHAMENLSEQLWKLKRDVPAAYKRLIHWFALSPEQATNIHPTVSQIDKIVNNLDFRAGFVFSATQSPLAMEMDIGGIARVLRIIHRTPKDRPHYIIGYMGSSHTNAWNFFFSNYYPSMHKLVNIDSEKTGEGITHVSLDPDDRDMRVFRSILLELTDWEQ